MGEIVEGVEGVEVVEVVEIVELGRLFSKKTNTRVAAKPAKF
jgi:hypothetical protein